jgi:hypothetical protein
MSSCAVGDRLATRPALRGRRVMVDADGELGPDRVLRAWWRGGRPTRVVLGTRGARVVYAVAMPGEVYARRWLLRVGDDGAAAR